MQGQKRAFGSLPEGLSFDHGSSSSGTGIDEQIYWNNMRNSSQGHLSGYNMSLSNSSDIQDGQNLSGWNIGEGSSSAAQNYPGHNEHRAHHGWSSSAKAYVGAGPSFDAQHYGPTSMLRLDDDSVNFNRNQIANGPLFMQSSNSDSIPQDLNLNSSFASHGVVEGRAFNSDSSGSSSNPFGEPSGGSGYKRKSLEVSIGQSSGSGSSSFFQHPDNVWHAAPTRSLSMSTPTEESIIPRLGLGGGVGTSENPIVLGSPGPVDNSRRNFRIRINGSHQQDVIPATNNIIQVGSSVENASQASLYPSSSRRLSRSNGHRDLPSMAAVTDASGLPQGHSVSHVPSLRRSSQLPRWNRSSISRTTRSSNLLISGERESESREEPSSRNMPRTILDHPIIAPSTEPRNSAPQHGFTWSSIGGNTMPPGNLSSNSRAASSSGVQPSSDPNSALHRSSPHYSRRLSEIVRRSLLTASDIQAGRGQTNNVTPPASGTSASLQEGSLPSGTGEQGHHRHYLSRSALLLERHLGGALGLPLRSLAGTSDGRTRLVSEIRNVLEAIRRGEGLRPEDVMILDQSVLYGMVDVHDRHRDMRLDVDNMSYEELLALEERIGDVNTGLTEETISNRLKRIKYTASQTGQQDLEPCSICREEYNNGDDLGVLECGHDFHKDCIKQWLMQKNLCPICKSTGLAT